MSTRPKYTIPAYELSKALYQPEKAQKVYDSMSENEKEQTDYVMTLLYARKNALEKSSPDTLHRIFRNRLIIKDFLSTENIRQYLYYLGYSPEHLNVPLSPAETSPCLVTDW